MAKKTQAIQLQTEVGNDEEWEKLLQRDGLIVVDVYSEWCGPCSGMSATLKKLKLEIGGDVLQLATAKSDKITALERFRNKSEPTWMLISNGKMVNFMFGANAPKLTRLITDELRKENEAREGRDTRIMYDISELADEEKERLEVVENQVREAREKEEAKAAKELHERRTAECHNILENLNHLGIILIFPHARTAYQDALGDLLGEAGLAIQTTEKVDLTLPILEELFYFADEIPFPEESIEELTNNTSLILQIKPMHSRNEEESTDESVLKIVYGPMQKPPGNPDSPARILAKIPLGSEEEVTDQGEHVAIWAPEDKMIKATALKLFFTRITEHFIIPEPEPTPPHYAVVFEANRRHEIATIMEKYTDDILRYGFFSCEVPEEAKVVAKSIKKYDKTITRSPNERMVLQLSKKRSECVLAFAQLKPLYISPNPTEGKRECSIFFPDDYDEPPEEEEEEAEPETKEPETETQDEGVEFPEEGVQQEGEEVITTEEGKIVEEGVPPSEEGGEIPTTDEAPAVEEAPPVEPTEDVAPPQTEAEPAVAEIETSPTETQEPEPPSEEQPTEEVPPPAETPTTTEVTETTNEESPA